MATGKSEQEGKMQTLAVVCKKAADLIPCLPFKRLAESLNRVEPEFDKSST